jgi:hypothetical protein
VDDELPRLVRTNRSTLFRLDMTVCYLIRRPQRLIKVHVLLLSYLSKPKIHVVFRFIYIFLFVKPT